MLIASIGRRVGPIAQLLESQEFAVLKLIRYDEGDGDSLLVSNKFHQILMWIFMSFRCQWMELKQERIFAQLFLQLMD